MVTVTVDENICKGCELCVESCPKGIMALLKDKLNMKGYHPAGVTNLEQCTGCAFCATMCPDCAITVVK